MRLATYDDFTHQLTDGHREFFGHAGHSFDVAPGDTLTADITTLTPEGQQLARWALEAWTNVTGIEFRFVTGGAHITFDDNEATAYGRARAVGPGGEILKSHVNVPVEILENGSTIDSQAFGVYIHEIGHVLGLGHPGNYANPGATTYEADAKFLNDSWQASVMSYFDQTKNTYIDASFARPVTPMPADIIAIQSLYGVPPAINGGDTVYGYEGNVGGYLGRLFAAMSGGEPDSDVYGDGPVALTLYDNAGNDTLDLRWDADDQRVDLRPEGISDVLGLTGNLVIARDTALENYVAGWGDDAILGNDGANRLEGRAGNDTLAGGGGDDTLSGGSGNDRLAGSAGADTIDGGDGNDRLWYEASGAGVQVDLSAGTATGGHAEGDTFENVEGVVGSPHADTLIGGDDGDWLSGKAGDDVLAGGAGRDGLAGGAGADTMDGGTGHDRLSYSTSDAGVEVDLSAGTARGGHAEGDTFENVEEVVGSPYADTLTGGGGNDWLNGRGGDDWLAGGAGDDGLVGGAGADTLDGGDGHDRLWYGGSDVGVAVDLSAGTASGGHAEGDRFENIEGVGGSAHADTLSGGSGNDWLGGGGGDDTLVGGAGADTLEGGGDGDTASYASSSAGVRVRLRTGAATGGHAEGDTLRSIEHLEGSAHADTFIGNGAANRLAGGAGDDRLYGDWSNDTLVGGAGSDHLNGGGGDDTVSYAGSAAGVSVDLSAGTAGGGHAEGDTLRSIEGVIGSRHADILTGGDSDDTLTGGAGADRMDGGAGDDWLWYGASDAGVNVSLSTGAGSGGHAEGDTFSNVEGIGGSENADTLTGSSSDDTLRGGAGDDRLWGEEGDDALDGGAGYDQLHGGAGADRLDGGESDDDWANYGGSDAGVTINLATGTMQGGHAEGDTLVGIESINGSHHADHLTGDDGDNRFQGLAGADMIDGGEGRDTAGYWNSDAGVTVNLATGAAQGGHAEGDTLAGIEALSGSDHADHLTGDDGDNSLRGRAGNDTLEGSAGRDWLDGGEGADTFVFGDGDRVADFQDGSDLISINAFGDINADNFETNVTIRQSGDDVAVEIGDAVLTLIGVSAADVTAEDFLLA